MHGKALDYGLGCSVNRLSFAQETFTKARVTTVLCHSGGLSFPAGLSWIVD